MDSVIKFLRNWTLPCTMVFGATCYLIWHFLLPVSTQWRANAADIVAVVQPILIFTMLFISFCKIDIRDLRWKRWHFYGLAFQIFVFMLTGGLVYLYPDGAYRISLESAMICFICPTATAAAVLTQKLGGNGATLVSYTMFINLVTTVAVSAIVPILNPESGITFWVAFFKIMAKVFPMLICPFFLAVLVRYTMPNFHNRVISTRNLAFYIWAVSLSIAIAVTVRYAVSAENLTVATVIGIGLASLIACIAQFAFGKLFGRKYDDEISGGQALGQKNTVFAIWVEYTFFSPITSIAGGFYSIWHNVFNSWQLYRKNKENEKNGK
ncbi:MAG: transporter [Paludibacteraceae bacterium]|nr:transporter [Paludibacteraceae bacterium]